MLFCFSQDTKFHKMESRRVDHGQELRKFHNFVKRNLITNFVPPKCKKLVEIGAGMMGDRDKLEKIGCQRVECLDINEEFIKQGKKRTQDSNIFHWTVVDLSNIRGIEYLVKENVVSLPESVNTFSSQFSIGQIVHSKQHLREIVQWIACFLVPGGTWIGTLFDDGKLNNLLKMHPGSIYHGDSLNVGQNNDIEEEKSWISVSVKMPESKTAISLSESVIKFQDIVQIASECGLELIHSALFSDWYKQHSSFDLSDKDKPISFSNRSFAFFKTRSLNLVQ